MTGRELELIDGQVYEAALLASMVWDNAIIPQVAGRIDRDHFYRPEMQVLYDAILAVSRLGLAVDLVTLRRQLAHTRQLDEIGGVEFLVEVVESVPAASSWESYLAHVCDCYGHRRLHGFLRQAGEVIAGTSELAEKYAVLRNSLDSLCRDEHTEVALAADLVQSVSFERAANYLPTGFETMDRHILGLGRGTVTVVAGRTSMGKTALGLNVASNLCRKGHPVLYLACEMSGEQLLRRVLCSEAGVPLKPVLAGALWHNPHWEEKLKAARLQVGAWPLLILVRPHLTPASMRAEVLRMRAEYGIKAVFVDYVQQMRDDKQHSSPVEALTERMQSIQALATETDIPHVVMSQLNRACEAREDREPRLSDLRGSGGIEERADVVLLLHRPAYYTGDEDPTTKIFVAKHREAATGFFEMDFWGTILQFADKPEQEGVADGD